MRIFLSWSGSRSRQFADALRVWLRFVDPRFDPWMSPQTRKGEDWLDRIWAEINRAEAGISCITRENRDERWILFEAGALAQRLGKRGVCTFLLDLPPEDLEAPLANPQATRADKEEAFQLLDTLNSDLEPPRPSEELKQVFEEWWPELERKLREIPQASHESQRDEKEMIIELLDLTRAQSQRIAQKFPVSGPGFDKLFVGQDVEQFIKQGWSTEIDGDSNALDWTDHSQRGDHASIAGSWISRWNGGESGDKWTHGKAVVHTAGNYVAIWYEEDDARRIGPYLILARRRHDGMLAGRYVCLAADDDHSPWVGRVVDNSRIDGRWSQGRWDFRR